MGCKCDPVYYGADCSLKKCKYGVDPLFYDNVVGEKYVTKGINAARGTTALAVREALEALPNGVISANNQDVTGTPPAAVTVSAQGNAGAITTDGCIGAGVATNGASVGAGLGAQGAAGVSYGSEYTITFKNNPGSPEYWVANSRQGQFASRYSNRIGRINTLKYGSKLLYTNSDWRTTAPQHSLVKVGGQEFRITAVDAKFLTLDYAFLGADIVPVLTDTGITATAFDLTNNPDEMTVSGVTTQIIADSVAAGTGVYVRDCPMTTSTTASDNIATTGTTLKIQTGHDCQSNGYSAGGDIVYRRSDDPNNQNMYMSGDGLGTVTTKGLATSRGSPDVYFVDETQNQANAKAFIKSYVASTNTATFDAAHGAGTIDTLIFANGLGPIKLPAITAADTTVVSTDFANFFGADFSVANTKFPLYTAVASSDATAIAGKVLLINGRRYKIKSRASGTAAKVVLNENYAGGQLQTVCSTCVTAYTAAGTSLTVDQNILLAVDDRILVSGKVHEDFVSTIGTATGTGGVGGTAVVPGAAASDVGTLAGANRLDLIKLTDKESNTATII